MSEIDLTKWQSQLRKGALELCILGLISREPTYAFAMIQSLQANNGLTVTEGALYPLLKRLQKESQVETFWVESESGPPRKYYRLTDHGAELLKLMQHEWRVFSKFVNQMVCSDRSDSDAGELSALEVRSPAQS